MCKVSANCNHSQVAGDETIDYGRIEIQLVSNWKEFLVKEERQFFDDEGEFYDLDKKGTWEYCEEIKRHVIFCSRCGKRVARGLAVIKRSKGNYLFCGKVCKVEYFQAYVPCIRCRMPFKTSKSKIKYLFEEGTKAICESCKEIKLQDKILRRKKGKEYINQEKFIISKKDKADLFLGGMTLDVKYKDGNRLGVKCNQCPNIIERSGKELKGRDYIFCCKKCTDKWKAPLNTKCCVCGDMFHKTPAHAERSKNNYCSKKECTLAGTSGKNHHAYIEPESVNCHYCNEGLERKPYRFKKSEKHFCDPDCHHSFSVGENHPRYNQVEADCFWCDETFMSSPSTLLETSCCSTDCANDLHSFRMTGEGNSNYSTGECVGDSAKRVRVKYVGFTNSLKEKIRERDDRKCQLCPTTEEEHGMRLHVHHIDYTKDNSDDKNLIALCRYCHGKVHGKTVKEKYIKIFTEIMKTKYPDANH